jgi:hypothetical protein
VSRTYRRLKIWLIIMDFAEGNELVYVLEPNLGEPIEVSFFHVSEDRAVREEIKKHLMKH